MVSGKEFRKRLRETKNGCDKNCKTCCLYNKRCIYEAMRSYYARAEKQHIEFEKVINSYAAIRD